MVVSIVTKIRILKQITTLFRWSHSYICCIYSNKDKNFKAHLQSSVFKLSKDLIDSIHEEGIVAYTS